MPVPWSGCWEWMGYLDESNRGRFRLGDKMPLASRVSFRLYKGPIPFGLHVCHHCDNPSCVRPDHLFLGTNQDNVDDKVAKGRQLTGEKHNLAKLTWEQVQAIRQDTRYQYLIAKDYGISQPQVSHIKTGLHWKENQN